MKIAQISSIYLSIPPKTYGGTERIVFDLCQHLTRREHHVELFASGDSKVDCRLQLCCPWRVKTILSRRSIWRKNSRRATTYHLYRQADRFDIIAGIHPVFGALFSVALLLHTSKGRCYALDEVRGWIRAAGFSAIQGPFPSSPLAFDPDSVLIAEKS